MTKWTTKKLNNLVAKLGYSDSKDVVLSKGDIPLLLFTEQGGGDYPIIGMWYNNEYWEPASWNLYGEIAWAARRDPGSVHNLDFVRIRYNDNNTSQAQST